MMKVKGRIKEVVWRWAAGSKAWRSGQRVGDCSSRRLQNVCCNDLFKVQFAQHLQFYKCVMWNVYILLSALGMQSGHCFCYCLCTLQPVVKICSLQSTNHSAICTLCLHCIICAIWKPLCHLYNLKSTLWSAQSANYESLSRAAQPFPGVTWN